MSPESYSEELFKGPAYALVIGISNYEHGKEPGQLQGGYEFLNLTCPANDATDFADFLRNNGMIGDNVKTLIDDEATLPNIKLEIDRLREKCQEGAEEPDAEDEDSKRAGPLVVVFFSGHGMVDSKKRHYVLPWEAEGNNLFGTAFSHKDFWEYLDEIETNRLVVFLDACHSGTTGSKGAKGAAGAYNPLAELGEGAGRYSIASCGPGQYSYEARNARNSIFTKNLLGLLKCEDPQAIPKEEIDIFDLYHALKEKVKKEAKQFGDQEPMMPEARGATGMVLAINKYVREARKKDEQQYKEDRQQFLQMVCNKLAQNETYQTKIIRVLLVRYIEDSKKTDGYIEFYDLFDAFFETFRRKEPIHPDFCDSLVDQYKKSGSQPKSSGETRSQSPSKGSDEFVAAPQQPAALAQVKSAAPLGQAIAPAGQQPRRQFLPGDQEYMLAEIIIKPDFYLEERLLETRLAQPISEAEFMQQIHTIRKKRNNDDATNDLLQEIIRRFQEKWPNAPVAQTQTLSSLRAEIKTENQERIV